MKIVMTIDDCGAHPAVTRAAERLVREGLATAAGIVANGPDVEGAARLEKIGLGVHLDILRGRPVGHWQDRATLVDERGVFLGSAARLFARYAQGQVRHEHVEAEWRAQIERVVGLGLRPAHLSSHANVHAWPTLTKIAGQLASDYGIRWLRTPKKCAEVSQLDLNAMRMKFLNVCGVFDRKTAGVGWPDRGWGPNVGSSVETRGGTNGGTKGFSPSAFRAWLRDEIDELDSDAVIELCFRPGLISPGDPPIEGGYDPTIIAGVWQQHFTSLTADNWRETLDTLGLEPVGFAELTPRGG
ncbi:MAG: ChbG/HpnK family deacetylase [Pseudomonadota bacterium]